MLKNPDSEWYTYSDEDDCTDSGVVTSGVGVCVSNSHCRNDNGYYFLFPSRSKEAGY